MDRQITWKRLILFMALHTLVYTQNRFTPATLNFKNCDTGRTELSLILERTDQERNVADYAHT